MWVLLPLFCGDPSFSREGSAVGREPSLCWVRDGLLPGMGCQEQFHCESNFHKPISLPIRDTESQVSGMQHRPSRAGEGGASGAGPSRGLRPHLRPWPPLTVGHRNQAPGCHEPVSELSPGRARGQHHASGSPPHCLGPPGAPEGAGVVCASMAAHQPVSAVRVGGEACPLHGAVPSTLPVPLLAFSLLSFLLSVYCLDEWQPWHRRGWVAPWGSSGPHQGR